MQKIIASAQKTALGIFLGLGLGSIAIGAHAANWVSLGGTENSELFIDAASVQQNGDIRQAWSMWNFKEARKNGGDPSFPTLKSYQDLNLYNCKEGTMKLTREIIFADNNGQGDKRDHSDALTGMQFVKPVEGTTSELMLKNVCGAEIAPPAKKTQKAKKK